MNVYRFECVVWVRGETLEEAQKELHDEVKYYFSQAVAVIVSVAKKQD